MGSITAKRIADITIICATAPLWAPLAAFIAALVRLRLGHPVLFRQARPGLAGKPFTMLKFRTMTQAVDATGHLLPDAVRLPKFGRWLRATSLDELPELLNVLRGDMSLVGPRPLLMQYLDRYSPEQFRRHEVLPGITGWAQVNGRNALSWEDRFKLDTWYVDNQRISLDLKILVLTIRSVLLRTGISAPDEATMPEFLPTEFSTREDKHQTPNPNA